MPDLRVYVRSGFFILLCIGDCIMNLSKLEADIQIKQDILSFIENGGTIKVGKAKAVRKCQTFRNNKYSIFNMGHQASLTGRRNFVGRI